MSIVRTFRDLVAWQKSMDLARAAYGVTARMPTEERFGLTNQMRRAAVSVPSNIAEGFGRQSRQDYIKFLRTARGSLMELDTQHELATSMKLIAQDRRMVDLLAEVDRVLQGLIRGLERKVGE